MLKLLNPFLNKKIYNNKSNSKNKNKTFFPSSTREWDNSIYSYNKHIISLIPYAKTSVIKIIKSYFNMFNKNIERLVRKKRLLIRFRKLSSNKIFVSNGEYKYTNNKVIITLYCFNRQEYNYITKVKKLYLKIFFSKKRSFEKFFKKRIKLINKKTIRLINKNNINKLFVIRYLNYYNIKNYTVNKYIYNFHKKVINKSIKKIQTYLYYKQLLLINKNKLNYIYLQYLNKFLENIYNKNIEFNIINLKRFYLNSNILSEVVKLKITKNRKKLIKILNKIKNKIKIKENNIYLNKMPIVSKNKIEEYKKNLIENNVIKNLKYRHVTGFRLETKGRLTKRYTASRSLSKFRYKGSLLNINSSYMGLSSVILKGNLKPNIQYTILRSKTRIGSFGIKSWVSGN